MLASALKVTPIEVDEESGEESDGLSALREVEKNSAAEASQGARRGPPNQSLQTFHTPIPTLAPGKQKRWEFRCRLCNR